MIEVIVAVGILVILIFRNLFLNRTGSLVDDKEEISPSGLSETLTSQSETAEQTDAHDCGLVLRELSNMGCPWTQPSKEDLYTFDYQGLHFVLQPSQAENMYHFVLPHWYDIPFEDFETFAKMRNLLNDINRNNAVCAAFYVKDTEEEKIIVHTVADVFMHETLPDRGDYLRTVLGVMIDTRNYAAAQLD